MSYTKKAPSLLLINKFFRQIPMNHFPPKNLLNGNIKVGSHITFSPLKRCILNNIFGTQYWKVLVLTSKCCYQEMFQNNCHNPTQQQLNLTRLRLDTIINPNPPHPPQTIQHITLLNRHITLLNLHITLLNRHITLLNQYRIGDTTWRQPDVSLMWGWLQTVWGTRHRWVQTVTGG